MSGLHDCRKAFSETLVALAEADPRVVAVANDSVGSSNLKAFKERFPDWIGAILHLTEAKD